jgi:hypothetical protein
MANHSVNTCFHLDWPKEACDTLKHAVHCVIHGVSFESAEFKALSPEVKNSIQRILNNFDSTGMDIGIEILNHPLNGVIVRDVGGRFSPSMTADLLKAIMKDHDIDGTVSFSWSENSDIRRIDSFSGGGAMVSADNVYILHISEWIETVKKAIKKMKMDDDMEENSPAP